MSSPSFPSQEYRLLHSISRHFHPEHAGAWEITTGDDAAVRLCGDNRLVVTADAQVEGVHFRREHVTMRELGRRAMAVNLSDCASMGARPDGALIQLIFDRETITERDIRLLYQGFGDMCRRWRFPITGGDLAQGPSLIIGITLFGRTENTGRPLTRHGVHNGDTLWISGAPGESAAGRIALEHWGRRDVPPHFRSLVRKHLQPEPRIQTGLRLAAHPGVHAAIDISDGIAKDAATLCYENSLGLELFVDRLPASRPLRSLATQLETDWLDWFLTGGEDYELLFAADRSFDGGRSEGARLWPIGRFSNKETGIVLVMPDGTRSGLKTGGWDHLV